MAKPSAQMRIMEKKIRNAVFQAQKRAAKELVQILIDAIRIRVRQLKELADGTSIPSPLSEKYVKLRSKYSSRLSHDTTPETSNATATGQMINSMVGKAINGKIVIELKDNRRKELNKSKPKLKNSEVNKYYEKQKGEWFALSAEERQEGIDYATEIIKEEIKKVLK
jgi:hypothetical protein